MNDVLTKCSWYVELKVQALYSVLSIIIMAFQYAVQIRTAMGLYCHYCFVQVKDMKWGGLENKINKNKFFFPNFALLPHLFGLMEASMVANVCPERIMH